MILKVAKAFLLSLLACLGCAREEPTTRLQVTCSIFPLGDIAKNVGGEMVDVHTLVPPGASPHAFEPSAHEFRGFSRTKVLVIVGAGFEFWAEKLVTAASPESLTVVRVSDGLELMQLAGSGERISRTNGEEGNPHVWLDPLIVKESVRRIAWALSAADPRNAREYEKNAGDYLLRLDSLDLEIRKAVDSFRSREFVAFHPAWSYFARRYGLVEVGIIQETPGRDPTPRELKRIVEDIRKFNVKAVFAEPQLNPKAADVIAREAGVQLLLLDPLGGKGLPGRDSYLKLIRYNLEIMRKALG